MSSKPNIFVFIGADKERLGRIFKQAVTILQYRQFGNIEFRNIASLEILQYQNIVSQAILKYQNIASLEFSQYCESGNMLPLLVVLSLHCKCDRDLHLGMRCSPEYYLLKKWELGILPSIGYPCPPTLPFLGDILEQCGHSYTP